MVAHDKQNARLDREEKRQSQRERRGRGEQNFFRRFFIFSFYEQKNHITKTLEFTSHKMSSIVVA
jgi:hypothetical protein